MQQKQMSYSEITSLINKTADSLRSLGISPKEYKEKTIPFIILRRIECILDNTREEVQDLIQKKESEGKFPTEIDIKKVTKRPFYNTSSWTLGTLNPSSVLKDLEDYLNRFSPNVKEIFEKLSFNNTIKDLNEKKFLFNLCQKFSELDFHPNVVSDRMMTLIYEYFISKFGEASNDSSGEFMTPRDLVHLSTELLFAQDREIFEKSQGKVFTIYDQTCGTCGFLTDMMNYADQYREKNPLTPILIPHGQEIGDENYPIGKANILMKEVKEQERRDFSENIKIGDTLTEDQFPHEKFNYQCSNPPFGLEWGEQYSQIKEEHEKGEKGRFAAGLPRKSDGSMLFLQNLVSKLQTPENGGGKGAIVLSGSPLFNGMAGSGESEIRRSLLEQDLIEAIIALPKDMFFRTGIETYLWIISNRKDERKKGKVQLIDASGMGTLLNTNQGKKRQEITQKDISDIVKIFMDFQESDISKIFPYQEFGYRTIQIERPLRINLEFSEEAIEKILQEKEFLKLKEEERNLFIQYLETFKGQIKEGSFFSEFLEKSPFKKPSKTFKTSLIKILGVKDPEASIFELDGKVQWDPELEDSEDIPLKEEVQEYFQREVLPFIPDAVLKESYKDPKDQKIGKVGYEINFNKYFYCPEVLRHPSVIKEEMQERIERISRLLGEL